MKGEFEQLKLGVRGARALAVHSPWVDTLAKPGDQCH